MCRSQAEHLARLLPQSFVVKSFNVLSAYSLENGGLQSSKQVGERDGQPFDRISSRCFHCRHLSQGLMRSQETW